MARAAGSGSVSATQEVAVGKRLASVLPSFRPGASSAFPDRASAPSGRSIVPAPQPRRREGRLTGSGGGLERERPTATRTARRSVRHATPPTLLVVLVAVLFVVVTACGGDDGSDSLGTPEPPIPGSGVAATENREVASFTRVRIVSFADVAITLGEAQSVRVETDDNLLEWVRTEIRDTTLTISNARTLDTDLGIEVTIVVPTLDGIVIDGAADVTAAGLAGGALDVVINGAGDVEASGSVEELEAALNGAGNILCADLVAARAEASVNGSGNIEVHATESLDASINGSGTIAYTGDPALVERRVRGTGTISGR